MRAAIFVGLVFAFATVGIQAELPADNVVVAFDNLTQEDIRTAGVQNQISTKVNLSRFLSLATSNCKHTLITLSRPQSDRLNFS